MHDDVWAEDHDTPTNRPHQHHPHQHVSHGNDDPEDDLHGGGFEEDDDYILPTWTSKAIAQRRRAECQDYAWALEEPEFTSSITFKEPKYPFDHTEKAHTRIPGRGKIQTGLPYAAHFIEAIKWWFSLLKWTPLWQDRPKSRRPHEYTCTYLEMVVDFETASGIDIPISGWAQKANILSVALRSLSRIYTLLIDGHPTTWTTALEPKNARPTLTPLGAPRQPGPGRRPKWASPETTQIVAANVWRCFEDAKRNTRNRNPKQDYSIFSTYTLCRSGFRTKPFWKSKDEVLLKIKTKQVWDNYFSAVADWQARPIGPPPVRLGQPQSVFPPIRPPDCHVALLSSSASSSGCSPATLVATSLQQVREHASSTTVDAPARIGPLDPSPSSVQ